MRHSGNGMFASCAVALVILCAGLPAMAQQGMVTPVGLWQTIDDETKKPKALVRVTETDGTVSGRIETLIDPDKPDPVCDKCTDERKDKPVIGMTIMRGVKRNADETAQWDKGDILDPNNGKIYRVRLRPIEAGAKMEVRGYLGAPLFGRTQVWSRVE